LELLTLAIGGATLGGVLYYAYWAQIQATASKNAADAAESAAKTAANQLEVSERPWVLATHEIYEALTFRPNGYATLILNQTLENSGQSTAVNIGSWADIVPLGPNDSWEGAIARQKEYCSHHRTAASEPTNVVGGILFPKHQSSETQAMALTPAVLAEAKAANTNGLVGVAIVGCVWYRTIFEPKSTPSHQTQFAYLLAKRIGPSSTTVAALYSGIPVGIEPYMEPTGIHGELELIPQTEGNSAD
jgi:hypothetical protein